MGFNFRKKFRNCFTHLTTFNLCLCWCKIIKYKLHAVKVRKSQNSFWATREFFFTSEKKEILFGLKQDRKNYRRWSDVQAMKLSTIHKINWCCINFCIRHLGFLFWKKLNKSWYLCPRHLIWLWRWLNIFYIQYQHSNFEITKSGDEILRTIITCPWHQKRNHEFTNSRIESAAKCILKHLDLKKTLK